MGRKVIGVVVVRAGGFASGSATVSETGIGCGVCVWCVEKRARSLCKLGGQEDRKGLGWGGRFG